MGLACKFLQINPDGAVPLVPPSAPFLGNRITVKASALSQLIIFTASGANVAPAQTELLLQKLASVRRAPTDKYISQGFVTFAVGSLTQGISVIGRDLHSRLSLRQSPDRTNDRPAAPARNLDSVTPQSPSPDCVHSSRGRGKPDPLKLPLPCERSERIRAGNAAAR